MRRKVGKSSCSIVSTLTQANNKRPTAIKAMPLFCNVCPTFGVTEKACWVCKLAAAVIGQIDYKQTMIHVYC